MAKKENEKFLPSNIFEGITSIDAIIKAGAAGINDRKIEKVLYNKEKEKSKSRELAYLRRKAELMNFSIEAVAPEVIDEMTIGSSHGGIVAICSERTFTPLENFEIETNGFYVILDGIEDPYNFGYSLRSLYAAGVNGIILTERNWMGCAGVVCRASAGASEQFQMTACEPSKAVEIFKSAGYKIVCADKKNSVSIYQTELKKPILLIVGGEKRGISSSVLSRADNIVHIDYGRDFPLSLSAASASAIISFEIMRQNL